MEYCFNCDKELLSNGEVQMCQGILIYYIHKRRGLEFLFE